MACLSRLSGFFLLFFNLLNYLIFPYKHPISPAIWQNRAVNDSPNLPSYQPLIHFGTGEEYYTTLQSIFNYEYRLYYRYENREKQRNYRKKGKDKTTSFKVGKVYDISQTDGKLPTLSHELTENSPVLQKAISDIIKNSYEVKIRFDERLTANDCNGYYSPKYKSISLRANMSSAQTFKTLIHELAHSYLHNNTGNEYDRSKEEVEAESVAYSVCHCFGLDTSDYSFGYIASWSSDKNLKELKSSLNRIKSAVDKISEWVCNSTDLTYNTA